MDLDADDEKFQDWPISDETHVDDTLWETEEDKQMSIGTETERKETTKHKEEKNLEQESQELTIFRVIMQQEMKRQLATIDLGRFCQPLLPYFPMAVAYNYNSVNLNISRADIWKNKDEQKMQQVYDCDDVPRGDCCTFFFLKQNGIDAQGFCKFQSKHMSTDLHNHITSSSYCFLHGMSDYRCPKQHLVCLAFSKYISQLASLPLYPLHYTLKSEEKNKENAGFLTAPFIENAQKLLEALIEESLQSDWFVYAESLVNILRVLVMRGQLHALDTVLTAVVDGLLPGGLELHQIVGTQLFAQAARFAQLHVLYYLRDFVLKLPSKQLMQLDFNRIIQNIFTEGVVHGHPSVVRWCMESLCQTPHFNLTRIAVRPQQTMQQWLFVDEYEFPFTEECAKYREHGNLTTRQDCPFNLAIRCNHVWTIHLLTFHFQVCLPCDHRIKGLLPCQEQFVVGQFFEMTASLQTRQQYILGQRCLEYPPLSSPMTLLLLAVGAMEQFPLRPEMDDSSDQMVKCFSTLMGKIWGIKTFDSWTFEALSSYQHSIFHEHIQKQYRDVLKLIDADYVRPPFLPSMDSVLFMKMWNTHISIYAVRQLVLHLRPSTQRKVRGTTWTSWEKFGGSPLFTMDLVKEIASYLDKRFVRNSKTLIHHNAEPEEMA